ncbi:DUF3078 domain-containing protein [Flavicella sp.]|uniref:DUF3078 domain-containing protein n=1 Tax=Flavicella sp. TaxID=2957742 RepID=UPI0026207287|nr:DUF3078 domain-containing protein [Flavicella sp.]MDG1805210.1 DUF3078 domain-containing protein [Flavicella sp.]
MRQALFTTLYLLFTFSVSAHVEIDSLTPVKKEKVTTTQWAFKKTLGLLMTQTSFVNWSAGGENSIAGITTVDFEFNYIRDRLFWNNRFNSRFGLNKENGEPTRKTDDVIEFISSFGYRKTATSNWYNSARFNFRTQYAPGYKYPNREDYISKFFAPAYIFVGVGSQYTSPDKDFKLYLSPLTNKTTLVYDEILSNQGAFGVNKGERSKIEFGILTTGEWKHDLMENIVMNNKLILYTDYLNDFSNIDVDWELNLQLIVNKFVKANIGTHIVFDNDVVDKETGKPEIQLKQLLGVGIVYSF